MSRTMIIYSFNTNEKYLAQHLFPNAIVLNASILDDPHTILKKIPSHTNYFLFHINLSETTNIPKNRDTLIKRLHEEEIIPINNHLTDITKKNLTKMLGKANSKSLQASKVGNPDDPLIIKSNYNYGGLQEKKLEQHKRLALGISKTPKTKGIFKYQIKLRSDIKDELFEDKTLHIEQYVANNQDAFIRIYFLYDSFILSKAYTKKQIKKMYEGIRRENYFGNFSESCSTSNQNLDIECKNAIIETNKLRLACNIDYAALDLVFCNNKASYIVDINSTPFWGDESQAGFFKHLSNGLPIFK